MLFRSKREREEGKPEEMCRHWKSKKGIGWMRKIKDSNIKKEKKKEIKM